MRQRQFAPAWLTARPIAHRGLHDSTRRIVENTLGACKAAVDGDYAIECDLQITRDGEAVLFHDDALDRVMEVCGLVKNATVAELKKMRYRHSDESMPTLAELLSLVAGKVPLVIELKPQWDGDMALTQRAIEVLKIYDGPHCLMSFDPDVVEAVRLRAPSTIRGFISDRGHDGFYNRLPPRIQSELRTLSCLERIEPHFLSFDVDELPWAPVEELRSCGMPVITWTIRSPEQARMARRYSDQITFERFLA